MVLWWGDNPPYHAPTFVLTHHAREPIVMEGTELRQRTLYRSDRR
jgi:hypothetical protein